MSLQLSPNCPLTARCVSHSNRLNNYLVLIFNSLFVIRFSCSEKVMTLSILQSPTEYEYVNYLTM